MKADWVFEITFSALGVWIAPLARRVLKGPATRIAGLELTVLELNQLLLLLCMLNMILHLAMVDVVAIDAAHRVHVEGRLGMTAMLWKHNLLLLVLGSRSLICRIGDLLAWVLLDRVGHVLLVQTDRRGGRHTTRHRSLLLSTGGSHHVGVGGRDAAIHLLEEVPVLFLGSHHFLLRLA